MTQLHPLLEKEIKLFREKCKTYDKDGGFIVYIEDFDNKDFDVEIMESFLLNSLKRASMSVVEESVGDARNKYSVPFDDNGYPMGDPTDNQVIDTVADHTLATAREITETKE